MGITSGNFGRVKGAPKILRLLCLFLAVPLAACTSQEYLVDGKRYFGSDPLVLAMKRYSESGQVPQRISCRQFRSGPLARSKDHANTTIVWAKANQPDPEWVLTIGTKSEIEKSEKQARKKGLRKISADRFYHSVAKEEVYCAIWRAD